MFAPGATSADHVQTGSRAADGEPVWRTHSPLAAHLAAYAVMVVGLLALIPAAGSFSSDAGAYGGQVYALRHGGWALERPVAVVDEVNEGWLNTAITPDGPTPYTSNPSYALLLHGAASLVHGPGPGSGGPAEARAGDLALGLRLVPALSALAAAAGAWFLARRLAPDDPRAPAVAFWLLALSPVLVNATTLWAHTLTTALGAASLLAVLALTDDDRSADFDLRRPLGAGAALSATLVAAGAVRTEALFWVGAVTLTGLVRARRWSTRALVTGSGALGGAAWLGDRLWGARLRVDRLPIETNVDALSEGPDWLAGRLPAAWLVMVNGPAGGLGPLLTAAALSALAAAVLNARREGRAGHRVQVVLITAATVAYGIRLAIAPDVTISGLMGAWPAVAFLLLAARADPGRADAAGGTGAGAGRRGLRWILAPVALLTTLVLATQYSSGGGLQWGGRYLSFALAPLAVAAAIRGRALVERLRLPLVGLLIAPALCGAAVTVTLQRQHQRAVDQASAGAPVVVTESPALPRIAWPTLPVAFYRAEDDDVVALLGVLAGAGVAAVDVHGLGASDLDGVAGYRVTEVDGPRRRLELDPAAAVTPSPGVLAADP